MKHRKREKHQCFVILKEKSQKKEKEIEDRCLIKEQDESVPQFEDDYDTYELIFPASAAHTHS